MKKALLAVVAFATMAATSADIPPPIFLRLAEPTDRYDHAVLGDGIEYGALELFDTANARGVGNVLSRITLPETRVFEDIRIRLTRLSDESARHIVIVESDASLGAQLAVYEIAAANELRKRAATAHIGQRNRWLAPAAIADFDGDGINDIAYVETPHLAGILKIVTLRGDELVPIATPQPGFSNHRIGQDFITSDVRTCDGITELLLPDLDWTTLMAARLEDGEIASRPLPHPPSAEGIEAAKRCAQ